MSPSLDRRFFSICPYCSSIQSVLWNGLENRYQYAAHCFKQESLKDVPCFGSGTQHDAPKRDCDQAPGDF